MRRILLGTALVLLGLAYAWAGALACDPRGAAVLAVPLHGDVARWAVTQLWGLTMAGFLGAGAATLLDKIGFAAQRAIVALAVLAALAVAAIVGGGGAWSALAAVGGVALLATLTPARARAYATVAVRGE